MVLLQYFKSLSALNLSLSPYFLVIPSSPLPLSHYLTYIQLAQFHKGNRVAHNGDKRLVFTNIVNTGMIVLITFKLKIITIENKSQENKTVTLQGFNRDKNYILKWMTTLNSKPTTRAAAAAAVVRLEEMFRVKKADLGRSAT